MWIPGSPKSRYPLIDISPRGRDNRTFEGKRKSRVIYDSACFGPLGQLTGDIFIKGYALSLSLGELIMNRRDNRERSRRRSYRKEVAREEEQADLLVEKHEELLEKAEEIREIADDFIKALEDWYDEEDE